MAYLAVLNIVSYFIYMKNNKKDKCSNFDSKSWINPFGKTQYAHPKMELKQSCQFSLAKPHKEEKNTQNNQSMYYLTERPRNDQASWADNNIIYSHTFSRCHKGRLFFMEWVNQSVVITWHLPSTTPPPCQNYSLPSLLISQK